MSSAGSDRRSEDHRWQAVAGAMGAAGHSGNVGGFGRGILNHGTLALTDALVTVNASGSGRAARRPLPRA